MKHVIRPCVLFLAVSANGVLANSYSVEASGMGGTGYAVGNFSEGVLLNPSALAERAPERGGFGLQLNIGALVSDPHDIENQSNDLADLIDEIQNSSSLSSAQATELKSRLAALDGDQLDLQLGGGLVLAIANKEAVSFAAVLKGNAQVFFMAEADPGDMALIDGAVGEAFDPESETDGLNSKVVGKGAAITEAGLALAKSFSVHGNQKLLLGITPKLVQIKSFIYSSGVADFNEDDFDAEEFTRTEKTTSYDLGATYVIDKYRVALVVNNLKEQKLKTIAPNQYVLLERQAIASAGYAAEWGRAEVAYDLNAIAASGIGKEVQFLRAGAEFSPLQFLRLRAGLQKDLKNNLHDLVSFGMGLGPIDASYLSGDKKTQGFMLGFGMRL